MKLINLAFLLKKKDKVNINEIISLNKLMFLLKFKLIKDTFFGTIFFKLYGSLQHTKSLYFLLNSSMCLRVNDLKKFDVFEINAILSFCFI